MTSASGGTVAGTLPDPDANPDLLTAGKVLEGLIRGADAAPQWTYTAFAVGVLRTDWGAQTIIATDTGGGAWLPATVYLPSSARLATVDPTLPMGWGHRFMGWERPTDILIAHCEEVSRTASGVSLSAIATTDAFATIPTSVDSTVFNLRDVLRTPGEAPILDSTHRHRLAAVDTELARRCAAFKEGTDLSTWAATQLTVAIMQAAQIEGPVAGLNLVHPNDIATLLAVPAGNADWDAYVKHLGKDRTDVLHPSCRPHDLDDSPTTVNLRALYQHRFRAGRIVELVLAWRVQPASVRDVVYCALMAGFGANAAAALTKIEATAQ